MKYISLMLLLTILKLNLYGDTYIVDKETSKIEFEINHIIFTSVNGEFKNFKGKYIYNSDKDLLISGMGIVYVNSIDTDNKYRDEDLLDERFFNERKYPEIRFKILKINKKEVYGAFSLKGMTKNISFDLETYGIDFKNNEVTSSFSLKGKIKRSDFNLKWNKLLEAGGFFIGDDVTLNIKIEGVLKE